MNRLLGAVTLVVVFLALGVAGPAWCVGSINATLDRQEVTVGDPFTYTATLVLPPGATPTLPGEKAKFGKLEVRDYKPVDTPQANGTHQLVLQYTLVAFDTGPQEIGDFKVAVKTADGKADNYLAPPVTVTVKSVLPDKGKVQPRGFYGPVTLRAAWADWLQAGAIALAILAVVAVVLWLLRRRKQRAAAAVVPEIILAPDEAALTALQRLKESDLAARGDMLGFYLRLDEIMRSWLEARFDVPALHRTTLGLSYLLRVRRSTDEWRGDFMELAKRVAQVKFAAVVPEDATAYADVERAVAVIRAAAPPPAPVASPAEGQVES